MATRAERTAVASTSLRPHRGAGACWSTSVRVAIVALLIDALPAEASCLLLGSRTTVSPGVCWYCVHAFLPCWNPLSAGRSFAITRSAWKRAETVARETRSSIVGVCHSHPTGPALPSPRDLTARRAPSLVHVIAGFRNRQREPDLRCFRYAAASKGGSVAEVILYEVPDRSAAGSQANTATLCPNQEGAST
jgi:proteasome lid subunit RPN8/RPN11